MYQGCLDDFDEKFAYDFNWYLMGTLRYFQCEKVYPMYQRTL